MLHYTCTYVRIDTNQGQYQFLQNQWQKARLLQQEVSMYHCVQMTAVPSLTLVVKSERQLTNQITAPAQQTTDNIIKPVDLEKERGLAIFRGFEREFLGRTYV